ncbi:MAG: hypothetical protein WCT10_05920 [Patescibacteria group bacterium]|jgi:hypothetical protein
MNQNPVPARVRKFVVRVAVAVVSCLAGLAALGLIFPVKADLLGWLACLILFVATRVLMNFCHQEQDRQPSAERQIASVGPPEEKV